MALALPVFPVLQGRQVLLRELLPADAPAIQRHGDDEAVWAGVFEGFPKPYTLDLAQAFCGGDWRYSGLVWAIEYQGEAVGCISLRRDPDWMCCNAEVGYWLGRALWRRGLMREALELVSDWGFACIPDLTRQYARSFAWNEASQGLLRRAGFALEGRMPQSAIKNGRIEDLLLWGRYRPVAARP